IRETVEECGYRPRNLRLVGFGYPAPGTSDEKIWIYIADVSESDRVSDGGGLDSEGEDIRLVWMSYLQAMEAINDGIVDFKTQIALLHFANQDLREENAWLKAQKTTH